MAIEYPDDLNPFDTPESEDDETNPFKSSSEDLREQDSSPLKPVTIEVTSLSNRGISYSHVPTEESDTRSTNCVPILQSQDLVPLLPHCANVDDGVKESTSVSTTPTSVKVKRRAPPIPTRSPSENRRSLPVLPSPRAKKPAPRPPVKVAPAAEEAPPTVEHKLQLLAVNDNNHSDAISESIPGTSTSRPESLAGSDASLSLHTNPEDVDDPTFLALLNTLKNEHSRIETELRELIAIPTEQWTPAHISREEQLMKELVENVKKREQLEDEEDGLSEGHEEVHLQNTLQTGMPKKMRKKRKFKMKNLLGVKS